jgi:hypothetical protein
MKMGEQLIPVNAPPAAKRGWFQIHLMTALALTIAAGAVLGANLLINNDAFQRPGGTFSLGWPRDFYDRWTDDAGVPQIQFQYVWFIFDAVVALLVFILTGFIFEARMWGWPRGKIFVWAFIGVALTQPSHFALIFKEIRSIFHCKSLRVNKTLREKGCSEDL